MTDIAITRGDHRDYDITVTDAVGAAVNLTGCTLRFTARFPNSSYAFIEKDSTDSAEIAVVSAAAGTALLKLLPADTAKLPRRETTLKYDLELTQGSGVVTTLVDGDLTVSADVT